MNNKLLVVATFAFGTCLPVVALAADASESTGYVVDSRGTPVKSGTGLCWRTGYWTPSMATLECDPDLAKLKTAHLTPPPPKAPVLRSPTPTAEPSKPVRLSLSADGLFVFGKSTLLQDSKRQLNGVAAKLLTGNFSRIAIAGHTDRLGAKKVNQKLSLERANAVKAFLVSKGVDGGKILTEGKGSAEPKTLRGACKGKKNPKLIACLQPDRRVEITVVP